MRFFFACLFHLRNGCSANCATGSLIFENVLQFDLQKPFNQMAIVKNAHTHTRTHIQKNQSDCIRARQKWCSNFHKQNDCCGKWWCCRYPVLKNFSHSPSWFLSALAQLFLVFNKVQKIFMCSLLYIGNLDNLVYYRTATLWYPLCFMTVCRI